MIRRFLALLPGSIEARNAFDNRVGRSLPLDRVENNLGIGLYSDGTSIQTNGSPEIVLGTLFTKSQPTEQVSVLNAQAWGSFEAFADALITNYWGQYVAFFRTDDGNFRALRDPSGAVPCYALQTEYGVLIASDLDTLAYCHLPPMAVDWGYIGRHLLAPDLRTAETALVGLTEITAGTSLQTVGSAIRLATVWSPWSPWSHALAGRRQPDGLSPAALRETVQNCTVALARQFSGIMVSVSGGLDSSIVAGSLTSLKDKLTLFTMVTDEPEGDERRYSRQLADFLDVPMIEVPYCISEADLFTTSSAHLPRPTLPALVQQEFREKILAAKSRNIQAIFTGLGGDNVFCNMSSATPVVDRFLTTGISHELWQTVNDVCQNTGASYSRVIWAAAQRWCRFDSSYRWRAETRFVASDVVSHFAGKLDHPWLDAPKGGLPGSAAHIAKLARIQGSIDGLPRTEPMQVNPLLSQPVVEACVAIPTWQWVAGGRNRSVAREAFKGALPRTLIDRTSKGGPDSFAYRLIDSHRKQLRDFLLDGLLVQERIANRNSIEMALSLNRPVRSGDYVHLLILAEAEAWVRHRTAIYKASVAQQADVSTMRGAGTLPDEGRNFSQSAYSSVSTGHGLRSPFNQKSNH